MSYFAIKCCNPNISRLILLIFSILLACWGAVQLGYAGMLSLIKTKSIENLTLSLLGSYSAATVFQIRQSAILTDGAIAYYCVTGSVAIILGVALVLVLMEIIGKQSRQFYFKVLFWSLVVGLLLQFAATVYSSIMLPFYGLLFEAELAISQDLIDILPLQSAKDYYNGVRNFYRFTQAQVIITWILIVPTIALMLYTLIDEFFKGENAVEPTKIAPQRLNTESKVYQNPRVQSFGVQSFGTNTKSQEFSSINK